MVPNHGASNPRCYRSAILSATGSMGGEGRAFAIALARWREALFGAQELSRPELLVALAMLEMSNRARFAVGDYLVSWLSEENLAQRARLSTATMRRTRAKLRDRGIVVGKKGWRGNAAEYTFQVSWLAAAEEASRRREAASPVAPAPSKPKTISDVASSTAAGDLFPETPPLDRAPPTRLPSDFVVPPDWRKQATAKRAEYHLPAINIDVQAEIFANYWIAKPGKSGTKLDWRRTFLNWCLSTHASTRSGNGTGPLGRPAEAKSIGVAVGSPEWRQQQRDAGIE